MPIRKLNELFDKIKGKRARTFIVVNANDIHTLSAVSKAVEEQLINAILIGNEQLIRVFFKKNNIVQPQIRVFHETDEDKAAHLAIEMINQGDGDVLMKGLISTDKFIKAILNKEKGLVETGSLLSHVAVIENKNYHKLLIAGDVAVIPLPNLKQKEIIINYLVTTARRLGIDNPKVAIIAPTEKVVPSITSTLDAEALRKMNLSGQLKNCIIEGPLALDVALDTGAALMKGLDNPVAGDADCLLFANIDAGNVFYKANTKLAQAEAAAVLMGAKVPVVLASRGDSILTKRYSMALAALISMNESELTKPKKNKNMTSFKCY